MARTLGDAFMRVRPDLSYFPSELTGGLRRVFTQASRGSAGVLVAADTSRLPRQLEAEVRSAATTVTRRGSADVSVGAAIDRLPRQLEAGVRQAATRAERSGAADVEVRADTAKLEREMPSRIGGAARKAAALAAAGFATLQVGGFFKDSVAQASDLTESVNVVGLTFKEAAPELDAFFRTSAQSIGLSTSAAQQAASNIGGLLNNMGYTRSESAKTSKSVLTLGADLGSAFNKDPAQAVEAIGAALRGETEPIRAFNVTIDDARVKAKALEMGMYSGKGAIDANAKAQATLALITQQTADVQGDFANTSDGLANGQRVAAASYANLQSVIGQGLLPAQTELVNQVNQAVLPALSELAADKAPAVGEALKGAAIEAGAFVAGLQGQGPIDGFSGKLNTAGLGVRAFFLALKDGDVTSDGFVGKMERIGAGLRGVYELVVNRDFTSAFGQAFNVQEDSKVVDVLFRIRDAITGTYDLLVRGDFTSAFRNAFQVEEDSAVVDFLFRVRDGIGGLVDAARNVDLSQVQSALGGIVGDGEAAGTAVLSLADSAQKLAPFVLELVRSLPQVSDVLSVAAPVFGFLADHVDTLIQIMPLLVGAFIAYKVAQAAANLATLAAVPLRIAEIIGKRQHTAALTANTAALGAETTVKSRGTVATIAHTVAERALTIAKTVGSKALAIATAAWKALGAAMKANPIGVVITVIAALAAGLVWAYKNSETFRNIVDGALRVVAAAGKFMWEEVLKPAFLGLVAGVMNVWARFEEFRDRLTVVWAVVRTVVADAVTGLVDRVSAMPGQVLGFFAGLRDGARDRIQEMKDWVVDRANQILADYIAFGVQMHDRVLGFFAGLRDGARDRIQEMKDWVVDRANQILADYIAFGVQMHDRVLGFFAGLRDGARDRIQQMKDWLGEKARQILADYVAFGTNVRDRVLGFFSGLRDGARDRLVTMRDWLLGIVGGLRDGIAERAGLIRDGVVGAFEALRDRGRTAFEGLRDGVSEFMGGIRAAAAKPVNFVIKTVYMEGIKKLFDKVASAIGIKTRLPDLEEIPERRRGGWTPKGTVLVGEEGPELVNFARPGMVYTAKQTRQLLSRPDGEDGIGEANYGRTKVTDFQRSIADAGRLRVADRAPGFSVAAAAALWDGLAGLSVKAGSGSPQSTARALGQSSFSSSSTLGRADFPTGVIYLNKDADRTTAERRRTTMHEIGHVLGLLHPNTSRASAMKQSGSGGASAPTAFDIESLKSLYAGATTTEQDKVGTALSLAKGVAGAAFGASPLGRRLAAAKTVTGWAVGNLKSMVEDGVAGLLDKYPAAGMFGGVAKDAVKSLIDGLVAFAARKDAEAPTEAFGGSGGGGSFKAPTGIGGTSVAALVAYGRALRSQGLRVSSNAALGSPPTPGAHSSTGYHYKFGNSGAIDVNSHAGESAAEKRRLTPVALDALRRGFGVQWLSKGHFNHLHIDVGKYRAVGNTSAWMSDAADTFDLGGRARGRGYLPKATPKPERVLSPRQTETYDRSLPVLERLVELLDGGGASAGPLHLEGTLDMGDGLTGYVEGIATQVADRRAGARSKARTTSATYNPGG